jgi:hypothetical protein
LLYQAALSVASGEPFLEKKVRQGRVLVMDGENGIGQVAVMVDRLSAHLGLNSAPDNLLLWNLNDAPPHGNTVEFLGKVIAEVQPVWVIIDPINSLFNDIEKDASNDSDEAISRTPGADEEIPMCVQRGPPSEERVG